MAVTPVEPPDPLAVLDAMSAAFERVNGRGTHERAPALEDEAHPLVHQKMIDGRHDIDVYSVRVPSR